MEDSTEKTNKLHAQAARVTHYPFCPPTICDSLVEALMAILRFLGFKMDTQHTDDSSSATRNADGKPYSPISSSPEASYTGGSDLPPTKGDITEPIAAFSRRVPRPPRSRGGGGQTN